MDPRRGFSFLRNAGELPPRVEAATRSASDGTFRFRLARGVARDLRATHEGRAETVLPNCLAGERIRIVLRRGGTLVVLALDPKRNPVEGALVSLSRGVDGAEAVFEKKGRTDAAGRCVFPSLVPGWVTFGVTSTNCAFPEGSFTSVPREGSSTVEVVLREGPTVYGTVLDATTRAPVAGARVYLDPECAYLTDAGGRFAFPGWRTDGIPLSLRVDAEGYGSARVETSPSAAAEVLLTAEDRVEGRIVDAAGHPVAGALVTAFSPFIDLGRGRRDGDPPRTVASGPDGSFRIASLRHDLSHVLAARAEGHGPVIRSFGPAPWGAGVITLGDLPLPREASLEGALLNGKGRPIPLSLVRLEGPLEGDALESGAPPVEERRTDDLGRFRFRGLAPGGYRLSHRREDRRGPAPVHVEVRVAEGEEIRDLELRLPGGTLSALVLDPSGAPVPGATVIAYFPAEKFWNLSRWTDADGRARFESLFEGKVQLQAGVFQGSAMPFTGSDRTGPLDGDGSEVILVMRVKGSVRGKVLAADGSALEGVEVRAMDRDQANLYIAVTDAEGAFVLDAAAGVPLNIVVNGTVWKDRNDSSTRGPSALRASLPQVPVPSDGVEIRIGAPNLKSLTVRLVDPEGNPVEGVRIIEWRHSPPPSVVTGADGRARFEGLLPEECQFGCFPGRLPEGCVSPLHAVVVPDGQEVVMTCRRGVPFIGTVLRADGSPAAGARVSADGTDGTATFATAGPDGAFTVFVLPGAPLKELAASLQTGERTGEAVKVKDVDPAAGPVTLRLEAVGE